MTEHVDMGQFIAARSDQLNADDLLDGPRTITITKVTASPDAAEQPVSVHYDGDGGKPFKPCKTVRRIMVGVWGREAAKYVGRSMTVYRDPTVAFGGMQVGGLRVSHMSHIDEKKTVALQVTRGRKAPYTVLPLVDAPKDDPATKWANGFIAKLPTLSTIEAIDGFEAEKSAKLAELKAAKPELHAKVTMAILARKGELTPPSAATFDDELVSDDDSSIAPVDETPEPEPEKGEAERQVDQVIADATAATTSEELEKIVKEAEPHKAFLPDALATRLEIALDQQRQRFVDQPAA